MCFITKFLLWELPKESLYPVCHCKRCHAQPTSSAGPPERPVNCSVVNQTTESLVVECLPGFDGGLRQLFHMEVTDLQTGQLIANTSQGGKAAPEFEVSDGTINYFIYYE